MAAPKPIARAAVSGATGGIGRAVAHRYARDGVALVLIDRDQAALESLAKELGGATIVVCDQRKDSDIEAAAQAAGEIDAFINNAGIIIRKPLLEMTTDDINATFEVNALGSVKMAIAMARGMAARGSGVIINLSSQHAFVGAEGRGVYAATKAAIVQFTRTAAVEWAKHGIRVAGVAPGPVASPMTEEAMQSQAYRDAVLARMPVGRFLNTEEMAELIVQLASPAMASVVGHTIIADGGGSLT